MPATLRTLTRPLLFSLLALALAACSALPLRDPLRIELVGLEPLPGQGLEVRFAVKLRVQNPNDSAVEFDGVALAREWLRVRVPRRDWADLATRPGALALHPLAEGLDTLRNPAFLGRRQQHLRFDASTAMSLPGAGVAAGLATFQSETHWYLLGARRTSGGRLQVFLEGRWGTGAARTLATREVEAGGALRLKIDGDEGTSRFGVRP